MKGKLEIVEKRDSQAVDMDGFQLLEGASERIRRGGVLTNELVFDIIADALSRRYHNVANLFVAKTLRYAQYLHMYSMFDLIEEKRQLENRLASIHFLRHATENTVRVIENMLEIIRCTQGVKETDEQTGEHNHSRMSVIMESHTACIMSGCEAYQFALTDYFGERENLPILLNGQPCIYSSGLLVYSDQQAIEIDQSELAFLMSKDIREYMLKNIPRYSVSMTFSDYEAQLKKHLSKFQEINFVLQNNEYIELVEARNLVLNRLEPFIRQTRFYLLNSMKQLRPDEFEFLHQRLGYASNSKKSIDLGRLVDRLIHARVVGLDVNAFRNEQGLTLLDEFLIHRHVDGVIEAIEWLLDRGINPMIMSNSAAPTNALRVVASRLNNQRGQYLFRQEFVVIFDHVFRILNSLVNQNKDFPAPVKELAEMIQVTFIDELKVYYQACRQFCIKKNGGYSPNVSLARFVKNGRPLDLARVLNILIDKLTARDLIGVLDDFEALLPEFDKGVTGSKLYRMLKRIVGNGRVWLSIGSNLAACRELSVPVNLEDEVDGSYANSGRESVALNRYSYHAVGRPQAAGSFEDDQPGHDSAGKDECHLTQ